VNLAVQAILKELKENPVVPVLEVPAHLSALTDLHVYADTLSNEPVGQCRGIVNACRHSGQRHRRPQAVIEEGNNNGYWKGKLPDDKETLPVLRLLRDCSTRWSSTFKMIDRVLTLHPVIFSSPLTLFVRCLLPSIGYPIIPAGNPERGHCPPFHGLERC
jgi:hypothetical protein